MEPPAIPHGDQQGDLLRRDKRCFEVALQPVGRTGLCVRQARRFRLVPNARIIPLRTWRNPKSKRSIAPTSSMIKSIDALAFFSESYC